MQKNLFRLVFCLFSSSLMHANMLKDLAILMGAQIGASTANQSVNAKFTNMEKAFTKSQTHINAELTEFATAVKSANSAQLNTIANLFSQATTQTKALLTQQAGMLGTSVTYLQQAVSRAKPQENYVSHPVRTDQFFTDATMYTPQGPTWKNLFNPNGNWEYDENSDSFWQMSYAPFLTVPTTGSSTTPNADQAPTNSIFTEWITTAPSYKIECEITLYKIEYPFFVGLIFNKARWISGDMPRIQKYRMLGLYGNENKTANVCFAEAYTQPVAQTTTSSSPTAPTTIFPLQQVVAGSGVQKISINNDSLQTLTIQPITFRQQSN